MKFWLTIFILFTPFARAMDSYAPVDSRDYWLTGALIGGAFLSYQVEGGTHSVTHGAVDDGAREFLRARTQSGRDRAETWSNAALAFSFVPATIDAWVVTRNTGYMNGAKLFAIDAQAFALTGILTGATKNLMARERPFMRECREKGAAGRSECNDMTDDENFRSFYSGHTAYAFTAAGLTCFHHEQLRIYGGPGDAWMCGSALALAGVTGALRMGADKHYFSDVAVGAVVGFASGYYFPRLLHKRAGSEASSLWLPQYDGETLTVSKVIFF